MSSAEGTAKETSLKDIKDERLCVIKRVAELPLVSSAYEKVSATYTSAKESHPVIQAVCNRAEVGVKAIASTAASGAQPLLDKFEPQRNAKLIDRKSHGSSVLGFVPQLFSLSLSCSSVFRIEVVSGARGRLTEAAQESLEMAKSAMRIGMNGVMESDVWHMLLYRVSRILEHSDEWIEEYLPITDTELMDLANSAIREDFTNIPMPVLRNDLSNSMRLSLLSDKIRRRAYYITLEKIQRVQRTIDMTLFQLEQYMYMMKFTMRTWEHKFHQGQEKLQQIWQVYVRGWPRRKQFSELSQEEVASRALKMSQAISQQLEVNYLKLLADMEDLPDAIKEKVQQTQSNLEQLQAVVARDRTFDGIPIPLRHWSPEQIARVREALGNGSRKPPNTWVIGPFSSAGVHSEEITDSEEMAKVVA
ncbi:hypothetical protein JD844_009705 [Phrynosoma platyrhinos]|uniref:Perilipin n=1 Tax=Phrynosoma platyrhinos TaxID=52577 RepID=A0ABQ7TFF8_PHRPL|nr:hypothetical protein JD844_009705 [Phrynosoma platyrhinos]